jgi:hypothetical protein
LRLTEDELEELKKQKPTKCWRLFEPTTAEPGKCYSSAGEAYTVVSSDLLVAGDVMRRFGHAEYDRLHDELGRSWRQLWLIVVVHGDRTDTPRFLAHAGMGDDRDYAKRQRMTKTGKSTTMMDEPAVSDDVLAQLAAAAEAASEKKRVERRKRQALRRAEDRVRRLRKGVV